MVVARAYVDPISRDRKVRETAPFTCLAELGRRILCSPELFFHLYPTPVDYIVRRTFVKECIRSVERMIRTNS